ncbi:type IV pilus modification protein PilV [Cocleimonas flava]|uniref:Type IV pilus modification protein PilV n=1 Tax=Cocleimonas flava TaxID=634765 RepID=A0A4R1EVF7_9GAMM|nr:type IV pilus modification protein PilV [Cocleimonas flava]TCJ85273.1 type IV pilus modification protein PilV [Cocleimonas flava]
MLNTRTRIKGFSMIEVLVSLIVIGVGMLGLSGLQIASMKGTNNAHSRTTASYLAFELAERMRANQLGVDGGFYDNDVSCDVVEELCESDGTALDANTTYCTPQETARFDTQEVMCGTLTGATREGGIANLLANGSLDVSCVGLCSQANIEHNITISWNESKTHEDQPDEDQVQTITIPVIP